MRKELKCLVCKFPLFEIFNSDGKNLVKCGSCDREYFLTNGELRFK